VAKRLHVWDLDHGQWGDVVASLSIASYEDSLHGVLLINVGQYSSIVRSGHLHLYLTF